MSNFIIIICFFYFCICVKIIKNGDEKMEKKYIIALDEGTTSLRSILYNIKTNDIVSIVQFPFRQYYPKTGWVEQDASEIWNLQEQSLRNLITQAKIDPNEVIGLGITNQRETVVAWDRRTGEPITRAIVWQCRRTSPMIAKLPKNIVRKIKSKTGLIANSYFSASKMRWIMENVPMAKKLAKEKNLCLGTIDSYLAYRLTGKFVTDTTNASRTMLYNISELKWDKELLAYFKIPEHCLAQVVDSNAEVGQCLDYPFSLCGMIGDQQSSLFGQACNKKGMIKATYGTGCFILMNTGTQRMRNKGMLCTIASTIDGVTNYALEGSVFSACNAIDWLGNNLNLYEEVKDTSSICRSLDSNDDVYFVPAFTGLGAPYWNCFTRGTITGLTLSSTKAHIIRACIESLAYNTYAIVKAMSTKSMSKKSINIQELHVDGGGSKNEFLLQFQADMLQHSVLKSMESESTALGAIFMVALCKKVYTLKDISNIYKVKQTYTPSITKHTRDQLFNKWENAVKTAIYDSNRRRIK